MKLLKIARTPAVTIGTESTVRHAVETMVDCGAGAVVVVENQSAKGIFTASDLLKRVVAKGSLCLLFNSSAGTSSRRALKTEMRARTNDEIM